jgi:hypothetical protein
MPAHRLEQFRAFPGIEETVIKHPSEQIAK